MITSRGPVPLAALPPTAWADERAGNAAAADPAPTAAATPWPLADRTNSEPIPNALAYAAQPIAAARTVPMGFLGTPRAAPAAPPTPAAQQPAATAPAPSVASDSKDTSIAHADSQPLRLPGLLARLFVGGKDEEEDTATTAAPAPATPATSRKPDAAPETRSEKVAAMPLPAKRSKPDSYQLASAGSYQVAAAAPESIPAPRGYAASFKPVRFAQAANLIAPLNKSVSDILNERGYWQRLLGTEPATPAPTPVIAATPELPTPIPAPVVVAKPEPAASAATAKAEQLAPPPPGARSGVLGVLPAARVATAAPAPASVGTATAQDAAAPIRVRTLDYNSALELITSYPADRVKPLTPPAKPQHRGGWMIQVGAYPAEQAAKQRLTAVQSKASKMLAGAEAFADSIEMGGMTYYRSRFAGLDKEQAEAACKYLKRNDVECAIVYQVASIPAPRGYEVASASFKPVRFARASSEPADAPVALAFAAQPIATFLGTPRAAAAVASAVPASTAAIALRHVANLERIPLILKRSLHGGKS